MRRFTVSALGPAPQQIIPPRAEAVGMMKDFWEKQLDQVLPEHPDLIVLHECCDRYPAMKMEDRLAYYHDRGCAMLEFFQQKAKDNHCCITYSAVRELPDGSRRNSSQFIDREGKVAGIYDKNYPVIEETTVQNVLPGRKETIVENEFGRVGFAICFDLNFMELQERYIAAKPNLLLFSSMYHGGLAQAWWAYSCRSWFVGAIARDECTVLNPLGCKVACSTNYYPYVTASINTDYEVVHLDYNWERLVRARKKYGRKISVFDPGHLGCVLLSSETPELTAAQVVDEFEIERLDHYFERVIRFHKG